VDWKKQIQKIGPVRLGIVVLCGILLLLLSGIDWNFGQKNGEAESAAQTGSSETSSEESVEIYKEQVREELVALLGQVDGVGAVDVMVTVKASNEKVTLKDNTSKENGTEEETVLIEDSDKNSSPYVVQEKEPELEGVVVVCDGGDDAFVKREITDAVSALFQIESHKIKIMKSKEAKE
jgi:stage III sporulation protein AG